MSPEKVKTLLFYVKGADLIQVDNSPYLDPKKCIINEVLDKKFNVVLEFTWPGDDEDIGEEVVRITEEGLDQATIHHNEIRCEDENESYVTLKLFDLNLHNIHMYKK